MSRLPFLFSLPALLFVTVPRLPAETIEFNRDIRPILSDKCFSCHGPDAATRKTKLRFDIEPGASIELREGRHAIVGGDPEHSELVRRITSNDKAVRMPPAYMGRDKLTDRQISLIRDWITQGAKWQPFWSFIPPQRPAVPAIANAGWPKNPIDNFVFAKLAREGLAPSPEADKRTLIRRVTLDLTGIPPTLAEIDAFLADSSPNAFEKVCDRLLQSPRYAERMAYRWMEAARYGDTNGYQTDGPREMWRWRDWVIDAFNRNMPYDQFTIEQLAGDLLPNPTLSQRVATGFNRNHRTSGEGGIIPEEYRVEYVADRAQTTSIVWMGLTMGCARCHDHKYDPISQKDFYRLFAYFNRVPNEKGFAFNYGNEEPFVKAPLPEQEKKLADLDQKAATLSQKYDKAQPRIAKLQRTWEHKVNQDGEDWTVTRDLNYRSDASIATHFDGKEFATIDKRVAAFGYMEPFTFSAWIKPESDKGGILSQAEDYFEGMGHTLYLIDGKLRLHIVLRWTDLALRLETVKTLPLHEWHHVTATYDGKRKSPGVHLYIDGEPQETKVLFDQLNEPFKVKENVPFRIGAAGGLRFNGSIEDVRVYKAALAPEECAAIAAREPVSEIAKLRAAQRSKAQSAKLALAFLDRAAPSDIKSLRANLLAARVEREKFYDSIPSVMVMVDDVKARESFLLKRGAYDAPGEKVTPGIASILPQIDPNLPDNRLGLARWLVDRRNPLTARVTVNRFWQSYFGYGIVKTVDDFGSQGEWPTNPELLDWLAVQFMDSGWDVKAMQKLIVTSATYRQSSKVSPELLQKDPDNRLLARGPRFRLGPEVVRDQALAVSGLLVDKVGGPSVKPYQPAGLWQELAGGGGYVQDKGEGLYRRSLYTYWKRTVTPPFMANFDSPNREVCTVYENRTNTPLQALDLMNDVLFLEADRKLAERMIAEGGTTPDERLRYAYNLLLARPPRPAEERILTKALAGFESTYQKDPAAAEEFLNHGESPRKPGIGAADLAAYTSVASMLFNLDAAINKE